MAILTNCAILVKGFIRNISVKLFLIWNSGLGGDVFKNISYLERWGLYVRRSDFGTGHLDKWPSSGGDVV